MEIDLLRATAADLHDLLNSGQLTSLELVQQCHRQILRHNDRLKALITITPSEYLEDVATKMDQERQRGCIRSPLHGIPFVVKNAFNTTEDMKLQTTNGGWAFEDCRPPHTAKVITQAIDAGMILMGKANLSQFGNWKASNMPGGWSARGGQTQSAYVRGGVIDDGIYGHSNPSGSSTGSAVAVSAGFAPVSIGSDFNGSLTNPAIRASLYTIRVTPGIVSEAGGFPFSVDRDSVDPMANGVEDLVNFLNIIADKSHPRVPSQGYGTEKRLGWGDLTIATLDPRKWYLSEQVQKPQPGALDQIIRETLEAYEKLKSLAHRVIGPVELMTDDVLSATNEDMMKIIISSLSELIAFNQQHRDIELPAAEYPHQDKLEQSVEFCNSLSKEGYARLDRAVTAAGLENSIDKVLRENHADLIIAPADSFVPDVTAFAKYPSVTLPLGYLDWNGDHLDC
ncbi:amidase family protein [Pochonia chlamydosporia 170]|uniref:Amidase family protein n=1 Tax=Pochonia chlamydosporia 170 TaxID=1380566 RepID=A0A179F9G4_METCM|nr:amidase family protein [Pochonia chlamydosporia 170]OAQ62037.1 amidase family protein [Pochonia chlamydosporia 170]